MSEEIRLGTIVETPDGNGDVVKVNNSTVEVSLNNGEPDNAEEQTAPHAGLYKTSDCELINAS